MSIRKKITREVVASNSLYIDPLYCDSTVSYKVIDRGTRAWGSVQLSDCNRKIEWYFGDNESAAKVDKAIALLMEFKDVLTHTRAKIKERAKARRKVATKKKAVVAKS